MENTRYRFHRRLGFQGADGVMFKEAGDHVDLPEEVVRSPYFSAVMKEGWVEEIGAVKVVADTQALEDAQKERDAALAEVAKLKEALSAKGAGADGEPAADMPKPDSAEKPAEGGKAPKAKGK